MGWSDHEPTSGPVTLELQPSALESARFGLRVGRLTVPPGPTPLAAVHDALQALDGYDLVVVRFPAEHTGWFAALDTPTHRSIHADALQYWSKPVGGPSETATAADVSRATASDAAVVEALTAAVFDGYRNHYSANPLIRAEDSLAGYVEWSVSLIEKTDSTVLLLGGDGRPSAIAAIDGSDGVAEVALAGVSPEARGRGVYRTLLGVVDHWAHVNGFTQVVISTQAHNVAPQRAWASTGYLPQFTIETLHLTRAELLGR